MNPTPGQIASIKSFVAGLAGVWSNTDVQIRAAMTATMVANPIQPVPSTPTPFHLTGLLGQLGSTSIANLKSFAGLDQLIADVNANNIASCQAWCTYLPAAGVITSTEATACLAVINATTPGPTQVSWDVANLGRPADDFDIEAARL